MSIQVWPSGRTIMRIPPEKEPSLTPVYSMFRVVTSSNFFHEILSWGLADWLWRDGVAGGGANTDTITRALAGDKCKSKRAAKRSEIERGSLIVFEQVMSRTLCTFGLLGLKLIWRLRQISNITKYFVESMPKTVQNISWSTTRPMKKQAFTLCYSTLSHLVVFGTFESMLRLE